jgi:chaperonin GroES
MNLKPLGDRVVVKPLEEEEAMQSGLYIPDTAKEKPIKGEVISVGPGKVLDNGSRVAMDLNPGQKVIFAKYGGTEIKLDGNKYMILSERDVLAIID